MATYLIMLSVIYLARYLFPQKNNSRAEEKKWLFFAFVIISLVQGFRALSVGTDTQVYATIFLQQATNSFEVGYQFLSKLVYAIFPNAYFFMLVEAMIINGLVLRAIYKLSKDIYVSVFAYISLFYYFNSFNATRQYLAIAILLTSYTFLTERKYILTVVFFVLSILFHTTAVIGILLVPISMYNQFLKNRENRESDTNNINRYRKQERFKKIIIPVLVSVAINFAFVNFFNLVVSYFPTYEFYLSSGSYLMQGTGAIQQKIVYTAITLSYILFADDDSLTIILSVCVAFSFMMSRMLAFSRFLWYYDIFSVFALAEIWHSHRFTTESLRIVRCLLVIVCLAFMLYYLYVGMMRVTPYRFFFL